MRGRGCAGAVPSRHHDACIWINAVRSMPWRDGMPHGVAYGTALADSDLHFIALEPTMISSREDVTRMIMSAKVRKGIKWRDVTEATGLSKEWTTAACLGQMTLTKPQAEAVGKMFELSDEAIAWLQIVPYKGSLPTAVPTDPLIYRWYELVNVYGTTIKELIHEEFGDGIMSAIDFSMDIQRAEDPKGDRVNVVLSGKFLPYKTY